MADGDFLYCYQSRFKDDFSIDFPFISFREVFLCLFSDLSDWTGLVLTASNKENVERVAKYADSHDRPATSIELLRWFEGRPRNSLCHTTVRPPVRSIADCGKVKSEKKYISKEQTRYTQVSNV